MKMFGIKQCLRSRYLIQNNLVRILMKKPLVFISYSHKNELEKDRLLAHLQVLEQGKYISIWSDDVLTGGENWKKEIQMAMASARVAVLLVTAEFLTSDFILKEEVPHLLKRREREGLIVFPVIAKPCAWRKIKWLFQMNVRPKNGMPIWTDEGRSVDRNLAQIAEEIYEIIHRKNQNAKSSNTLIRQKILIVEDKLSDRKTIKSILKSTNYGFLEAPSVDIAKDILETNDSIELIILDIQLPGVTGIDLLQFNKETGFKYKIIVLTSYQNQLSSNMAKEYKISYFLDKGSSIPVQPLRFAVERALAENEPSRRSNKKKKRTFKTKQDKGVENDNKIKDLIGKGESSEVEFKSSARWDMKENRLNKEISRAIIKTVSAFLNSYGGGKLIIGVDNDKRVIGLEHDYKTLKLEQARDSYENFLMSLILNACGKNCIPYINISFSNIDGKDVCIITIKPSHKAIFIKDEKGDGFYVRAGNASRPLSHEETLEYCRNRWKGK